MSQTKQDPGVTLPLIDVKIANENVRTLRNYLDKGFKSGQYNMEDAENIINILNNLLKINEHVDMYQKFMIMTSKKEKEKDKEIKL
jgi:hypothetical protein